MRATISEFGPVTVPAWLRWEMHQEAGQTVLWEKVSATECRLVVVAKDDPLGTLGFARQHGLEGGSADEYLRELRAGEENDGEEAS